MQHGNNYNLNVNVADEHENRKRLLLESLFFEQIGARQSNIQRAIPDILEWAFERSEPPDSYKDEDSGELVTMHDDLGLSQPQWNIFAQWLQEGSSIYWVRRKAGSDKSTCQVSGGDAKLPVG